MSKDGNREKLIELIDKKAFDPFFKSFPDRFTGEEREKFEYIKKKTENEKKKFHKDYKTASEVKDNYLDNAAMKINHDLEKRGFPTLPQFKEEFMELCKKLSVS